jgi:hypothetical protein
MVGERGRTIFDIEQFEGFANYKRNREEIVELVNNLHTYLKLSGEVKYFECSDYKQSLEEYDSVDFDRVFDDEDGVEEVWTSWILFGFNDIYKRNIDFDGDDEDLFIAIDVFENGDAKLRIKSPSYCAKKFNDYYGEFGIELMGNFNSDKESDFLDHIRALTQIM